MGFDLHGKTVGVIGTGKIGECVCRILHGYGCQIYANDVEQNEAVSGFVKYASIDEILPMVDVLTLHCPLTADTHHLIDAGAIGKMKSGAVIVNTSRGGLVCTDAIIEGLKRKHIGGVAIDVYEEEAPLFFDDHSQDVISDDVFARLVTFPNVLVTGHQAFFTSEALTQIADTTLNNICQLSNGEECPNAVV